MRFLIDMPVTPDAVPHLRASGHDAVHASSIGLAEATDHGIIEAARFGTGGSSSRLTLTIPGWCWSVMREVQASSSSGADRTRTTRC